MLGDINNSDLMYTGDTGDAPWTMQYYRNKILEYQGVLNGLDIAVKSAYDLLDADITDDISARLGDWLVSVDDKRNEFKAMTTAINIGSDFVNSVGGRAPSIQLPQSLGFFQIPLVTIAAIGAVIALVAWGRSAIQGYIDITVSAQNIAAAQQLPPEQQAIVLTHKTEADSAARVANASSSTFGLSNITGAVKYLMIGGVILMLMNGNK